MIERAYCSPVTATDTGPFSLFCQSISFIDCCRDVKRIPQMLQKILLKDIAYPSFNSVDVKVCVVTLT